MVDNSGFSISGAGKVLVLPKIEGATQETGFGERVNDSNNGGITSYGANRNVSIPLALPDIANAARDFTTTGNLTYGYSHTNQFYAPVVYEQVFKNFTVDSGHQITIPPETVAIIRASETITIGGNGITGTTNSNAGCFLAYPYDHADRQITSNSNGLNKSGGGSGSVGIGGGQPQKTHSQGNGESGLAGGFSTTSNSTTMRSALVLIADTITINGNITLNGSNGLTGAISTGGDGGGHGGYVYLIANTINYSGGTINVSGGNGGAGGSGNTGGGGGGHCGILYTHARTYSGSSTTITASAGTGGAGQGTGGNGSDGGYPYPTMSTGEYRIEGKPF